MDTHKALWPGFQKVPTPLSFATRNGEENNDSPQPRTDDDDYERHTPQPDKRGDEREPKSPAVH